jgi:hypothetical protein
MEKNKIKSGGAELLYVRKTYVLTLTINNKKLLIDVKVGIDDDYDQTIDFDLTQYLEILTESEVVFLENYIKSYDFDEVY